MSFTLIRYKDGKEIPIKVSILDAFRSTPPRRPKAVQIEKKAETKHSPVKGGTSPKPTSNDNATKDTNNAKNSSNHEEESYTAEENAKIVEMKAVPGTSWNDIKEAIGKKSVSQLKDHYKMHLGPNAEAEQKKAAERAAKAEKNKAEGLAKQAEEGGKKAVEEGGKKCDEASGGGGGGGGKKKKKGGAGEGAADGQGGKNERKEKADANAKEGSNNAEATPASLTKQNLLTFVKKYERDKWLAAASRHYDLTGQRISSEVAKMMAEQK